ncbi:sugar transferase [Nocardioides sp. KR10-350]|uniref:sugar transferase n=1 Tax=Nocardioides cheoyonin TaxID=3156615 RepID=UPI0032B5B729
MTILSERRGVRGIAGPSRSLRYLPATAFLLDLAVMVGACLVGVLGRLHLPVFHSLTDVSSRVTVIGPVLIATWAATLWVLGAYRSEIFGAGTDEFKRVVSSSVHAAGLLGVVCYLGKFPLPRGFFVLTYAVGVPALVIGRAVLRRLLHSARTKGVLQERVLIVGGPSQIDDVATVLRRERWLGYTVVGAVVPSSYAEPETAGGVPVLGRADDIGALPAWCGGVDVLFMTGGLSYGSTELRKLVWQLEQYAVQLVVAPAVTDFSGERVRARPVGGLPLVHLEGPRWQHAARWAKRAFDVAGSSILLVLGLPVFVVAAGWIKLHDRGPVLFKQNRTGRNGVEFACLKFRTMVVDAEALLARLHEEQGYAGGLFKMKDDPRITRPGRLLRRFSLDELPQLINVVRGDMSLVGPRPPLPTEVATYDPDTARRLRVRPGLTGLWQVSGRSDLSWEDSIRLDLFYVDNWSMLQDISILGRTVGAVLGRRGAY